MPKNKNKFALYLEVGNLKGKKLKKLIKKTSKNLDAFRCGKADLILPQRAGYGSRIEIFPNE